MTPTISILRRTAFCFALFSLLLLGSSDAALAHCDTLDGPVIAAARQALDKQDPNLVLIWVAKSDEPEIRAAFDKALAVRKLGPAAHEMADTYFFETLVRLHRQGEGAPYTGLKPAGTDLGPAVPAADTALATGNLEPVSALLTEAVQTGLRKQFEGVRAKKDFRTADVAAGRQYVEAYVQYVHYVERLYEAATAEAHGHYAEGGAAACKE